jgi:hypothetical protein
MTTTQGRGVSASAEGATDWQIDPAIEGALTALASDPGLRVEIGALRLVLVRLLQEEADTARLAGYAARVAGVAVQAVKAQHAITGDAGEDTADILSRLLLGADDIPTTPQRKEAS